MFEYLLYIIGLGEKTVFANAFQVKEGLMIFKENEKVVFVSPVNITVITEINESEPCFD